MTVEEARCTDYPQAFRERNFGVIDIDWQDGFALQLRILDEAGTPRLEHRLTTRALRV